MIEIHIVEVISYDVHFLVAPCNVVVKPTLFLAPSDVAGSQILRAMVLGRYMIIVPCSIVRKPIL